MHSYQYIRESTLSQYFGSNAEAQLNFLIVFRESSTSTFQKLECALNEHKYSDANIHAHNLCSALKYIEIMDLAGTFGEIEKITETQNINNSEVTETFTKASAKFFEVVSEIETYVNDRKHEQNL